MTRSTQRRVRAVLSMIVLGCAVAFRSAIAVAAPQPAPRFDHRHQTGLALLPGVGYRVLVPYHERTDCVDSSGDASKRVCTGAAPVFLDLQVSFGATERLDVIVDLRFGMARDRVSQSRPFALAPGVRFWLDQDVVKFFTTVQVLYDRTNHHGVVATDDFGLRNSNGLMYDVTRNAGIYFQFGESMGFRRWFRIELDAGLGVQVRFP